PNTYQEIFDMLVERTSRAEVDWKPTSSENTFIVNFQGFSLSITHGSTLGLPFIKFEIRDSQGLKVDSFIIEEIEKYWEKASGLFSLARQQALKIDKAIAVISDELKKAKKVGSPIDK
ncbi:MAG: hypothetical protein Q8L00_12840, partial [Deltaproteobacteria bacterium]|nr:hypothetical protein [Deltaproteobacteria bacterium]